MLTQSDDENDHCILARFFRSGRPNSKELWGETDTPTDILPNGSASCVQNFDDSLDSAIRMTYRISLRSSSLWEPRHPLLKVFMFNNFEASFEVYIV